MAKKKRFLVLPRTTHRMEGGLDTGAGHKSFKGKTAMYVKDAAEAREIDSQYGFAGGTREVFVHEDYKVGRFVTNEEGEIHNYFFGSTKTYSEGWERIFGKRRVNAGDEPEVQDAFEKREEKRRRKHKRTSFWKGLLENETQVRQEES